MAAPKSDTKELILRPPTKVVERLGEVFGKTGMRSANGLAVELLVAAVSLLIDKNMRPALPISLGILRQKLHDFPVDPYVSDQLAPSARTMEEPGAKDRERVNQLIDMLEREQIKREKAENDLAELRLKFEGQS